MTSSSARKSSHRRSRHWKVSNGPSPRAKPMGVFEIVCFSILGGFAVGLFVGLGMGGVFSPNYSPEPKIVSDAPLASSQTLNEEERQAQIAASLRRLADQGLDVDQLKYKGMDLSELAEEAFEQLDSDGPLYLAE